MKATAKQFHLQCTYYLVDTFKKEAGILTPKLIQLLFSIRSTQITSNMYHWNY